jgi:hypothetical protein
MNSSMNGIAYQAESWSTLFSAETSASAALTGLLFVSLSINLQQIVKSRHLTARAGKSLAMLTAVLVMSTLCLIPGQRAFVLGAELGVAAVLIWITIAALHRLAVHMNPLVGPAARGVHFVLVQVSALPMLLAAISLMLGRGGGLYWLVVGTLFSFLSALVDAWLLLIDIHR